MHGALRDALAYVEGVVAIELNAAQENPLPIPDEGRIVSVANFEILPLATALDFLRIALAPALSSAAERAVKLLQAPLTDLPEGLAPRSGLAENSLSEFGVPVQALAAEARLLAAPVSYELVSTTHAEGIEDRMTMAPLAARRTAEMVALGERLVAIELVIACQAVELRAAHPGAGREAAGEAAGLRAGTRPAGEAAHPGAGTGAAGEDAGHGAGAGSGGERAGHGAVTGAKGEAADHRTRAGAGGGPVRLGASTRRAHEAVREVVAFMDEGDPIPQDLEPVVALIRAGAIT